MPSPSPEDRIAALEAELGRERSMRAELEHALFQLDPGGERARKIFQNAADAILLVDYNGKYIYATPSIERVTGYTVEETLGTSATSWLHPDDLETHLAKVRALRDGKWDQSAKATTYRRKHKTRGWVWVEALGANMLDDPAVGAIVVTMRDMTERRLILEELERAKEAAEAASFTKSAFLANMSHELRTPLNGVIGMVDLLARSPLDDRQRRYTEVARSSADILLAVINDILDFSKIEAGKLELEEVAFSLSEVVEEVAGVLALSAEQKGLELTCRTNPGLAQAVLGDPARVRQVLVNLVNNAIKFTARGEVAIAAHVSGDPSAGEVVAHLEVRDTGIGITPEAQKRLFQPFSQADTSTTRTHGGTGLGLAICHQLVTRMGGSLTCESQSGHGSTFRVSLPLARAAQAPAPPDAFATRHLAGRRVLAVDDNATNRQVLQEHLNAIGMRCDVAADGASALQMMRGCAETEPYTLAIVDVNMPGMDGLDLVRIIKGDARLATTVLLILGSLGRPLDVVEQRAMGIAGYASKPVWRRQLLRVIGDALAAPSAMATSGGAQVPNLAAPAPAPVSIEAGPLRALVVEDSDINAEVAGELLRSQGIEFDIAVNGIVAVAAVLSRRYDLVLMDCQLPEMDGFEATRRIRQAEAAGEVPGRAGVRLPILALTASATTEDLAHCVQAGMDGHVTKPVDSRRLFDAIEQVGCRPRLSGQR